MIWKTLKLFLSEQGIITKSPKETFKEAFRYGLIKDEDTFLDMIDDRNATSHIYSEEASEKIFSRIKKSYFPAFKKLVTELKKLSRSSKR